MNRGRLYKIRPYPQDCAEAQEPTIPFQVTGQTLHILSQPPSLSLTCRTCSIPLVIVPISLWLTPGKNSDSIREENAVYSHIRTSAISSSNLSTTHSYLPTPNAQAMLHRTLPCLTTLHNVVPPHLRCWARRLPSSSSPKLSTNSTRSASSSSADPPRASLRTFLAHAKRTHLDRTSTTFSGTYYEYATQALLRRYGFELDRVGGRGDRGVDLRGVWRICTATAGGDTAGADSDSSSKTEIQMEVPVIIQCKRLKSKVGPNLIRELEGALAGRGNTLGVLVGTQGATRGVREAMGRSRVGICWVMLQLVGKDDGGNGEEGGGDEEAEQDKENGKERGIDAVLHSMKDELISKAPSAVSKILDPSNISPPNDQTEEPPAQLGRVRQMLWNRAASNMGLEGLDVVMKYDGTRDEDGEVGKEVMLMWQGNSVLELGEGKD